uniref:Uncharacterized protein n=1 Tax=Acrobeloides nanus TaxID=290746 RepID=A0A914EP68_9BILA
MLIKMSIKNFIDDSGLLIDKESIRISGETSVKLTKIKAILELTLDILFFFGAIIELAYGKKSGQTVKNNVFDDIEDEIEIHSGFTKFAAYVFVVYAMINFITLMAILMKKPSMLIGECYFKV